MSDNTKTGLQWLNPMPEPYQSQARAAIELQDSEYIFDEFFQSFGPFIRSAFSWANSEVCETADESAQYWRNFKENAPEHFRD